MRTHKEQGFGKLAPASDEWQKRHQKWSREPRTVTCQALRRLYQLQQETERSLNVHPIRRQTNTILKLK